MARVLLVDDERSIRFTLREFLRGAGHQVETVENATRALALLAQQAFDVVLSDIVLPGLSGVDLLAHIRETAPDIQVILMTGEPTIETAAAAVRAGAADYLVKPANRAAILRAVGNAARIKELLDAQGRLAAANESYRRELEQRVEERTQELRRANEDLRRSMEELRAAQQGQLRQERLNALGQMASGIAHDFNNVLMPILGLTDSILDDPTSLDRREQCLADLAQVNAAARDAREIVRRLREFYRPDEQEDLQPVNLRQAVQDATALCETAWRTQARASGAEIRIRGDVPAGIVVPAAESRLREVLLNLLLNAVDAMPRGGDIHVDGAHTANGATLTIRDTGVGMPPDLLARCMEPYFTTKSHGSGLGLSLCHGILKRHGAALEIESAPDVGTTVRIVFPTPTAPSAALAAPPHAVATGQTPALRVLAIDDDRNSRIVLERIASSLGHTVILASGVQEAIAQLAARPFDLVLTDRTLADGSGDEIAAHAVALQPAPRVIMVTGFGDLMRLHGDRPPGIDALLSKPLTRQELERSIHEVWQTTREVPQ